MILSIVSVLFVGYLSSCSRGSVSAETTAVLLGGWSGKTESCPCDVEIGDIGMLEGLGAAVLNGQIVYCGGWDSASDDHRRTCYKNEGGDWIEFESMNVARSFFTLTTLGDKILAAGGDTLQWDITASVEVFDGSSWKFQNYELTSARSGHCAVPISESQEVILIGGYDTFGDYSSLVETYSIDKGFIAELPSMPTERAGLGCSMFKGEIWTAGGATYNGNGYLDVVEILTPLTNTWRSGPKLTRRRSGLTMEVLDNSLVVFGGFDGNGAQGGLDNLEFLEDEEWREEPLQYKHVSHASVSIPCN